MIFWSKEEGWKERETERNTDWLPPICLNQGLNLQPRVCALTVDLAANLLVYGTMMQSTEPPYQGSSLPFPLWLWSNSLGEPMLIASASSPSSW